MCALLLTRKSPVVSLREESLAIGVEIPGESAGMEKIRPIRIVEETGHWKGVQFSDPITNPPQPPVRQSLLPRTPFSGNLSDHPLIHIPPFVARDSVLGCVHSNISQALRRQWLWRVLAVAAVAGVSALHLLPFNPVCGQKDPGALEAGDIGAPDMAMGLKSKSIIRKNRTIPAHGDLNHSPALKSA